MVGCQRRFYPLQRYLLVIASLLPLLVCDCPYHTDRDSPDCQSDYELQINNIESLLFTERLYTGIDVETIRSHCDSLLNAYGCAASLSKTCAANRQKAFLRNVGNSSIALLCVHPHMYEVYSRNQHCYLALSDQLQECGDEFDAHVQIVLEHAQSGNEAALARLCAYLNTLLSCIRSRIESSDVCMREALDLVDVLVKPSVQMSEHCHPDHLHSKSTTPTTSTDSRTATGRGVVSGTYVYWYLLSLVIARATL